MLGYVHELLYLFNYILFNNCPREQRVLLFHVEFILIYSAKFTSLLNNDFIDDNL